MFGISAATGGAVNDQVVFFQQVKQLRQDKTSNAIEGAKQALLQYMLQRTFRPFNIIRPRGGSVVPRMLMLPCPDNLGDHDLDSTEDAPCGSDPRSVRGVTGKVLSAGSRFGRLPDRQRFLFAEGEVGDGLGADFRDGDDNRLWYALSRNLAPAKSGKPFNPHRLSAVSDDWLTVLRAPLGQPANEVLSTRVAAVVLSPGAAQAGRISESFLATASLNVNMVTVSSYLDSAGGESNSDSDGVFVRAMTSDSFNDQIAFISSEELWNPYGEFMRRYRTFSGATDEHNAPAPGLPLAHIQTALLRWKNFFNLYPAPAANTTAHVQERSRHCAVSRTQTSSRAFMQTDAPLLTPTLLTLTSVVDNVGQLASSVAFLPAHPVVASLVATIQAQVRDEKKFLFGPVTLGQYARVSLQPGARIAVADDILQTVSGEWHLAAGATVSLVGNEEIVIPDQTPLAPGGMLSGWLPEHAIPPMTANRDGWFLTSAAPVVAGFLGDAILSDAVGTVTLSSEHRVMMSGKIRMEDDFIKASLNAAGMTLFHRGVFVQTLRFGMRPDIRTYDKRHFAVLALSDLTGSGKVTVRAPAVMYPWTAKAGSQAPPVSRDNLHSYPPCFDSRSLPRAVRAFIEDHNIFYAVAPGCDFGNCGADGITVSLSAGARVSAPASFQLNASYTATLLLPTHSEVLTIQSGTPTRNLQFPHPAILPTADASQVMLTAGFVFDRGEQITIDKGSSIIAGQNARIENAEAILIYSPGPLLNVRCTAGMPDVRTVGARSFASQGMPDDDLTTLCQWLDDDENADDDLQFVISPPRSLREGESNDFFLIFGGDVVLE